MSPRTTRTQILDKAEALFARKGFAGTRTRDIADAVGVTTAMIHYYFETKEKLLVAVIERIMSDLGAILDKIDPDLLSHEEALEEFIGAYFDYVRTHPNFARLTRMAVGIRKQDLLEEQLVEFFRPLLGAGMLFIQDGINAGAFRPVNPEQLVISLYCATVAYFTDAPFLGLILGQDTVSPEMIRARRESILELAFNALGVKRPGGPATE